MENIISQLESGQKLGWFESKAKLLAVWKISKFRFQQCLMIDPVVVI